MSLSQTKVSSLVSSRNLSPNRFTRVTSAPAARRILGLSRANRRTSTTELAWSEKGYTRPEGSATVSSPKERNQPRVFSGGNAFKAKAGKSGSSPW